MVYNNVMYGCILTILIICFTRSMLIDNNNNNNNNNNIRNNRNLLRSLEEIEEIEKIEEIDIYSLIDTDIIGASEEEEEQNLFNNKNTTTTATTATTTTTTTTNNTNNTNTTMNVNFINMTNIKIEEQAIVVDAINSMGDIDGDPLISERPMINNLLERVYENQENTEGKYPDCAWQVIYDPEKNTYVMLDTNSIYHLHIIKYARELEAIRIRGKFPQVRYFSIQLYDQRGQPIDSFPDYKIIPSKGKNPFSDLTATATAEHINNDSNDNDNDNDNEEEGEFSVYLTVDGISGGYDNEMKMKGKTMDDFGFIMFRLYTYDPIIVEPDTHEYNKWGYVEPPEISYNYYWNIRDNTGGSRLTVIDPEGFVTKKQCKMEEVDKASRRTDSMLRRFDRLTTYPGTEVTECPLAFISPQSVTNQFYLYGTGIEPDVLTDMIVFTNYDSNYLYWCDFAVKDEMVPHYGKENGQNDLRLELPPRLGEGNKWIARVTGILPTTPDGLYSGNRIADFESYQSRYISINTYESMMPIETFRSISDNTIKTFYTDESKQHNFTFADTGEWNRQYSVVVAPNEESLTHCKHLYNSDQDMFLPVNREGLPNARVPGIIYREILSNTRLTDKPGENLEELKRKCNEDEGETICTKEDTFASLAESTLNEYYPQIEVFTCNYETGESFQLV